MNEDFITYEEVQEILEEVIQKFLIPRFIDLGMPASGEWVDNIHARGSSIWGRDYTEQLIYGRRPGEFAPIAPLIKWVEVKLGIYGDEAVSVAWAVNHKIKNEGTNYFQQGGTTLMEVLKENEVQDYIISRARGIIQKNVVFEIRRKLRGQFK